MNFHGPLKDPEKVGAKAPRHYKSILDYISSKGFDAKERVAKERENKNELIRD